MSAERESARHDVWKYAVMIWEVGLVVASAGNVSCRIDDEDAIAVTPSGVNYDVLEVDDIAIVSMSGELIDGPKKPTSELRTHLRVYETRADCGAIIHTHSPYVTALSMLRKPLPVVIDEMAVWLGGEVPIAEYGFTGTDELADNVASKLGDCAGVILANHGNICVGKTLDGAFHVAQVMESCARAYVIALGAGEPVTLPDWAITRGAAMYARHRR